jgi:signal transduction histidine kinase
VHYGPSPLQRELRYMPFVLLGIFLVFMAVAIQGLRYLKLSEQRSIWVGLAKETAHQLGTPLSAMLGWVQLIKDRAESKGYDDIRASIEEMEVDLGRLNKVTERFSKIGSTPVGRDRPAARARAHGRVLPQAAPQLEGPFVDHAPVRRRGARARQYRVARVGVREPHQERGRRAGRSGRDDRARAASPDAAKKFVEVTVHDTGRGIRSAQRRRLSSGFTANAAVEGWAWLARRIVEEYGGSIKLVE